MGKGVRIRFIGDPTPFPGRLKDMIENMEREFKDNDRMVLNIALNYGGRSELVSAARLLAEEIKSGSFVPRILTKRK